MLTVFLITDTAEQSSGHCTGKVFVAVYLEDKNYPRLETLASVFSKTAEFLRTLASCVYPGQPTNAYGSVVSPLLISQVAIVSIQSSITICSCIDGKEKLHPPSFLTMASANSANNKSSIVFPILKCRQNSWSSMLGIISSAKHFTLARSSRRANMPSKLISSSLYTE
ncbi:hypothetical protein CHS0354_037722 [Potamilus streckersoni]|uniref:Uncharacterized protein n=1 Tax=Potamilus streckersoni TaxID=2493646 RepID=A0AAE0T060_9BIVA|nr:hypothetical protein CHS0354_037722 [Potamilus streckersoni]